uniref:glycine zipper 2TM domain-containing protein n=1 Tax=Sphingomonas sp. TaxID=28214 RepID=UPI0025D55751|nr:glycine zipper 2TM domain-containing protein [Sphingomonas sp.]
MNRLIITAAAFGASLLAIAPATAQTAQETARFTAAQDRLNNEMQLFRAESDRYRAAIARRPGGYQQQYNDPRYNDPRYDNQSYNDANGGYARADDNYYDPSRDYRTGNYQERTLSTDERVYRGTDGKYYCKRNDGTTGLIIGAAGGALLGNVIDGGRSRIVGTLLGGAAGALAGKAIDQGSTGNQVRCR